MNKVSKRDNKDVRNVCKLSTCAMYSLHTFNSISHVIIVYIDNIDNENINFEKGHVRYFN